MGHQVGFCSRRFPSVSHFDASPSQLCFSLKVSLNGKCCLCMLQLCHAVTPMLAGRADWRRGAGGGGGGQCGEEEGEGVGWGGKQQTNSFSFVLEEWLLQKPLGVSSQARPCSFQPCFRLSLLALVFAAPLAKRDG